MAISRALENEKSFMGMSMTRRNRKIDLVSLNNRFKILTKSFSKFNPT